MALKGFLVLVIFTTIWSYVSANQEETLARVLIIQDRSVEDGYNIEIESNGEKRELKVSPLENIWSDAAQALHIETRKNGEKLYERVNIPKNLKVYHDQNKGSFLSIKDGKLNGIVDSDYSIRSEGEEHFVRRLNIDAKFKDIDYKIIDDDPITASPLEQAFRKYNPRFYNRAVDSYTPEVAVIVDSELANQLGSNSKVYDYLTIFWNAVKKRFETITAPKINIKLVGCVIMRNPQDEPFITNNKNEEGRLDCSAALTDAGKWIAERYDTIPEHDLMYVQDGTRFIEWAGLAWVGGVCWKNPTQSYAVGIGEDLEACYDGVGTAIHEVAHILGSPHDPQTEDKTDECSWDIGYIMSYIFGNINHLFFSPCSIESMAKTLESSRGTCTTQNLSKTKPPGVFTSSKLPGEVISMTDQCKALMKDGTATVYTDVESEDELCYDLKCMAKRENGYIIVYTYKPAPEGSLCPSGKRCSNGKCV